MGGGPATIDLWDLKPGEATGGPFRQIGTSGDVQICEHLPMIAKQMHNLSIVRSMSTREADHDRGRYYMHTGFVPNANIEHPSYGAVLSHEIMANRNDLEIPPFVSIDGASEAGGVLGDVLGSIFCDERWRYPQLGHGSQRQSVDTTDGRSRYD